MIKTIHAIEGLSQWVGKAFGWCIMILTLSVSYEVFVRYVDADESRFGEQDDDPLTTRPSRVIYQIHHLGPTYECIVNQNENSGAWVSCGIFEFGVGALVQLNTVNGGSEGVVADAVALALRQ